MFITENQNVGDSVLFLLSSRAALANIVEVSGTENASQLVSFIYNEASDYEIMHLLLNGSLPNEKYNDVAEMLLFSEFKESVMMNKDFVTEMVGEDIFENILYEVDSLYMQYSTAKPIIEFEANQDQEIGLAWFIHEAGETAAAEIAKRKAAAAAARHAAARGGMKQAAFKKSSAALDTAARQKASAAASGMKGGAGAPSYLARGKGIAAKKVAAGKAAVSSKYAAGKAAGAKGLAALKSKAAGMTAKYTGNTAAQKAAISKAAASSPSAHAALIAKKKAHATTAKLGSMKGANLAIAKNKLATAGKAVTKFAGTTAGKATGGAAAAALAIYAGAKIYKRFFSQAAKACGGQSGDAKTSCMNKYKKGAIMKQAAAIQSASGTCAKSKNPEKCKAGVATKVQSLKAKAAQIAA